MKIDLPSPSLVLLVGPSGSGKSTFARTHFRPTEVVSSDRCRAWVADDENDQSATGDAFRILHEIVRARLGRGLLTVVDATNVQPAARKALIALAKEAYLFTTAIVFDLPEAVCVARNEVREDRRIGEHVVRRQLKDLSRSIRGFEKEGIRRAHVFRDEAAIGEAEIVRVPLLPDRREESGPFDIVGDVHGCLGELTALLEKLGWPITDGRIGPNGYRRLIFLGDLVDRGPDSPGVVELVRRAVEDGLALAVPGNHDAKIAKWLGGKKIAEAHGADLTMAQYEARPELREPHREFLDGLVSHLVLDGGDLVVAHAGMKESMQGRSSGAVRGFALYGETTGETDEFGLPVRHPWAEEYGGKARVVYGHTPTPEVHWRNGTLCLDTGCVFGGKLSALRYPEMEVVDVPAERAWAVPVRPLAPTAIDSPLPDAAALAGAKLVLETEWRGQVIVREENTAAAFEVLSRFAVDPRFLVHLPPTMAPVATSRHPEYLERPEEAFAYFAEEGIGRVVCEEKHMGSRAILLLGRDPDAFVRRFGRGNGLGLALTRKGRRFFERPDDEAEAIGRFVRAAETTGLWDELATDWMIVDAEILPWTVKAGALIENQYRPVAESAVAATDAALRFAVGDDPAVVALRERVTARAESARRYAEAYRRYAPEVRGMEDVRIAPFHLLASEGAVHTERDHLWHLARFAPLAAADPMVIATRHLEADPRDPEEAVRWWEALTEAGGEGMVVKPMGFLSRGRRGWVQPALKVRGREYLRIIYGPDYVAPENLARLKDRSIAPKRALAMREFALGLEGLRRFVAGDGPARVFPYAFAVLALETEPVDSRL